MSGHQLTEDNNDSEIQSNKSCEIFANNQWCARLYAEVDLQEMKDISKAQHKRQIKYIDE